MDSVTLRNGVKMPLLEFRCGSRICVLLFSSRFQGGFSLFKPCSFYGTDAREHRGGDAVGGGT